MKIYASRLLLCLLLFSAGNGVQAKAQETRRTLLTRTAPVYPELARRMRVSGPITLLVTIEPDGHVEEIHFQSGHPLLAQAAQDSVRQWRYAQAPERSMRIVIVDFTLAK